MPSASALCRSDMELVESAEIPLNSSPRINLKVTVTPAMLPQARWDFLATNGKVRLQRCGPLSLAKTQARVLIAPVTGRELPF